MTYEEHYALLKRFEVDRLLRLVHLEAKKHHEGQYAIFVQEVGDINGDMIDDFTVAFGQPADRQDSGWYNFATKSRIPPPPPWGWSTAEQQRLSVPTYPTLKEALIAALITGVTYQAAGDDACKRNFHGEEIGYARRERGPQNWTVEEIPHP